MFTGIVGQIGRVQRITGTTEKHIAIACMQPIEDISIGESIAVNGICLTVDAFTESSYTCYASPHTVKTTNIHALTIGAYVNLERALLPTTRLGGHFVTGHVDTTVTLLQKRYHGEALILSCSLPKEVERYIVAKGSVALQGISLTVATLERESFSLAIIPETQRSTTIQYWNVHDILNLEVDILAKYIERMIQPSSSSITKNFLHEHGFLK